MKFCIYIFLFAVLFRPVFPILDYVLNYRYISTELCENKYYPELDCNGKCHLKKELAKALKNETPSSNEKKSEITETILLYFESFPVFNFQNSQNVILEINSGYKNLYVYLNTYFVFRPPVFKY
ncbi:hypothetical protein [Flavobacterium sp. 1355]|jgi:hypothetical protein|uniref:hypothetical protein n=1 Tax=Flavobacterium sp. 1355 TaxID=2806571 RepID=UPI001AEAE927|nr:hypothetical protein [Flavobacterium sp. 1355]MBP1222990.1 hypothetical protein [Flavobacterium sp. 1355]